MNNKNPENLDQEEINKFDKLAHSWWDPNGPLKTLHQINPLRANFITDNIDINNKNILDIGCGAGLLSVKLAELGANVTGIDLAKKAIMAAKMHVLDQYKDKNINISFENIALDKLSERQNNSNPKNKYQIITCMEMLEHVPYPEKIIENACELLDDNGIIFLSTLNRNFKSYLKSIVGAEYLLKILPMNTHEYNKFIKPSELSAMLRANDLTIEKQIGIEYNILKDEFYLTNNIDVNYIVYARKNT
tara:strand:+ start:8128 stop:8868 length:741 start_codon:yes stop_codon:yes gene_type:complete